jgi:carboxypeptidase family protein/TonB-dependent receptor-like protein
MVVQKGAPMGLVSGRRAVRRLWCTVAFAACLILTSAHGTPASAQDVTGALEGTVVSPEGAPEPDVHVTVSGPHLQGVRETVTDRHGFFQFLVLPPGTYELRAGRIGSRPIRVRDIVVELGRTTAVPPLTLAAQPIPMDSVVVVAPAVSLDPVHTTMGGVLRAEDYAALPVDRDYKSIISILPHANQSVRGDPVNVGGSTGLENQYYVDGVNVTDTRWGNRATSLPYNFVRSVNVRSGGYEAQYGRALGAVVDAVTYSGTNQPEANLFGVTQPSSFTMDAKGASVLREEGPAYYDFGGRVSGPLVRDRLWYSIALNPRRDKVNIEVSNLGFFEDKTDAIRFANKLTWRASARTNLELSVFGDPTSHDKARPFPFAGITTIKNPDTFLERQDTGGTNATLRATVAAAKRVLLQAVIGGQWDRFSGDGATSVGRTEPLYIDYVDGSIEGGTGAWLHEDRGRTSVSTQGTLSLPKHTVLLGGNYEDVETTSSMAIRNIARTDTSTWFEDVESYSGSFHNRSPAVYIQDTWRLAERFALNAGLRWSGQYLIGASGNTGQSFPHEWQPRAGFNWELGSNGVQRVFGSYGRFYQTIPTNIAVYFFVDYHALFSTYATDPRQPGATPVAVSDGSSKESDYAKHIPGLEAENFDEFTLGYERVLGRSATVRARGIRRDLRSSFQWGWTSFLSPRAVLGTPGEGDFDFLPPPKRQYTALEFSAEGAWKRLNYRASYVLSRSWGNYPGLYDSDMSHPSPGQVTTFWMPNQAANSTGFLPNDQPQVFKLGADCPIPWNVRLGAFFTVASGTPINEFAAGPFGSGSPSFMVRRGTAGRTPTQWDLNLRLAYDLPLLQGPKTRLQLDVLHLGDPRGSVQVDEVHYNTLDANGNPATPSPNYKKPLQYQPPMAVRLGMEVTF